ncbi:unnamed protein product [Sphenostylis stenocarpa]|uniref:glucan endo-1,3-beta-D-glucosidase n=1 Tax=Sphenostylis stenocarpa TaxID=92480 RepID=A0AA86TEB8_9FABA|nr:unnamed protein product [Sphenostylis stenocarpa]
MPSLFTPSKTFSLPTLLLLLQLFTINLRSAADAQIGVCYGTMGDNLPSASEVVSLYISNNINRMRIYHPNQDALNALRSSSIELILGVANPDLQGLATSADNAIQWVQTNVLNYWPSVKIKYIAVGNEVSPVGGSSQYTQYVLPAIQNIYQAIRAQSLRDQIKYGMVNTDTRICLMQCWIRFMLQLVMWRFVVSESGWPSDGGFAATYDNADTYLDNLILRAKSGSPRRPSKSTEIYIFAMFDENQKSPEIEKHFGLFFPNKQEKYPFGFS